MTDTPNIMTILMEASNAWTQYVCSKFLELGESCQKLMALIYLGSIRNARIQLFTNEAIALDDPGSLALQKGMSVYSHRTLLKP